MKLETMNKNAIDRLKMHFQRKKAGCCQRCIAPFLTAIPINELVWSDRYEEVVQETIKL